MLNPDGRVILISGASRGIGRAIAQDLQGRGFRLSLGVRDVEAMRRAVAPWSGHPVQVVRFDAECWASHREWVDAAVGRFGRIDGLVNNAGLHHAMSLRDPDPEALDRLWAVNCKAPLHLIHCALPHLEACGSGRIVNIASLSGKRVRNDAVAYNMTKHAMIALNHAARRIAWDKGVRATAICPSFVRTDMTVNAAFPADRMTDPNDVAGLVAMLLALPNNASVAEVLVNCRLEDTV
jgi:NAD(P)-dependent dehydrogenase (short-subunit alcohol dehydrogenase family)